MPMRFSKFCCIGWLLISVACAQSDRQLMFAESDLDFPNPERGFYRYRELTEARNFDLRGENITLIFGRISADAFRNRPFSKEFLAKIQDGFDQAREQGIKVIPRVAYNHGPHPGNTARYGDDASKETILKHIEQLGRPVNVVPVSSMYSPSGVHNLAIAAASALLKASVNALDPARIASSCADDSTGFCSVGFCKSPVTTS